MTAGTGSGQVWVQVVDVDVAAGREISFGRNLAQRLGDRAADIRGAIEAGSETVAMAADPPLPGMSYRLSLSEDVDMTA